MRIFLITMLAAGGIGVVSASSTMGAPANGSAIVGAVEETSPVQDVRLFCYNRYSGRFMHWGACDSTPRVYCRTRYSNRFLHWGSC
jgi:hypothetical protein